MEGPTVVPENPPLSPVFPVWVRKRDGGLVPFEADRISQSLFAAAEALHQPDPFLCRELTDGVVHFLTAELTETTPTTAQIAELVVKVVRELGQPALAHAYAELQRPKSRRRSGTGGAGVDSQDRARAGVAQVHSASRFRMCPADDL